MSRTLSHLVACESLSADHREMERLLADFGEALSGLQHLPDSHVNAQLHQALAVATQIEAEINAHFAYEEQVLFPAVSPYHPMVLMEVEHEDLVAQRDSLLAQLKAPQQNATTLAQLQADGQRFISEMLDHIGREDAGIFPACEQALSDAEKTQVIAGIAQLRNLAKTAPLPSIYRPEKTFQVVQADIQAPLTRPINALRLLTDPNVEVKHLTLQAGQSLAKHWSPKPLLIVCLQGQGTFLSNNQTVPLTPGSCVVLSPQLQHAVQATSDCHMLLILLNETPCK
jgi:quercetin dioxygenase-like cupin family protein/hemerythrin-like domain-containing protein